MEVMRTGKPFQFTDIVTYPVLGDRTFIIKAFKVTNGMGHIGVDITERKQAEEEKDRILTQLREAMKHVKKLSGFLPICTYCKKIRDDEGYYHQIESYIREHSEAEFSHGICPDCERMHFPE